MKMVYDKINDMRGNLITVTAQNVGLSELARIDLKNGRSIYASVLSFEGDKVTLQVFENTRGISTSDKVTFLKHQMQAIFGDSLLGRWDIPHASGGAVASYHTEFYNWLAGIIGFEKKTIDATAENPSYVKW